MGFFNFFKRDITEEEFQEQQKVKRGLEKTRTGFFQSIVNTLTNAQIDDDLYDRREEQLILADVGPGPVAGSLRQTLLPVGEKARIARDSAAFADTAQLLNAAHQTALIIVLGRHKAADCRGFVGCIRRIHRYSPTRRSGHP